MSSVFTLYSSFLHHHTSSASSIFFLPSQPVHMSNKCSPPPKMTSFPSAKHFATPSGHASKPTGAHDGTAAPTDPGTLNCAFLMQELLTLARLSACYHSPLLSTNSLWVLPVPARVLLEAIHSTNDIRRACGEYFLTSCAIGHAFQVTAAQHNTEAPLTSSSHANSRNSASQPSLTPLTIFTRSFLMYPLYLIHAFAATDLHRSITHTELSLLASCPFCYIRWTIAQDHFCAILSCPTASHDFKPAADSTPKNTVLKYLLLTNTKQLLDHCDRAELAVSYSAAERDLFAACHHLLHATLQQIRSSYATDFLPWLDDPASKK
jgi:hypothetical protein